MLLATLPLGWRLSVYLLSGIAAGIANGIAGGGTFVTFPTLIATGASALTANFTTTVGVVPSYLGGIRGFRFQLRGHRDLIRSLVPSCVVGTALGCTLLLLGSPHLFALIVPWLIGAGTLLFALAPWITARLAHVDHAHRARRWGLFAGIFLVAVYGGYFGAGMGILLLAVMAVSLPLEIQDLQGLRSVLSLIINILAALIFVFRGHLIVDAVYMFLIGTLIGGALGAMFIRRLSPSVVRVVIIAVGIVTTVRLAVIA
ncbi:MAG: sulfite exporter TauE/SafE family protein [Acidimicrobiales bacterium]